MSLLPEFELGLWNAWILVIPMVIILFFENRVVPARESSVEKKGLEYLTKKERRTLNAMLFTMFASFVYAVFLPLQLGTAWFFPGLIIYLFGFFFTTTAILNFASTPKNELVTKGLYRISRNPMNIGWLMTQIGMSVACISWLYLMLTVVLMILINATTPSEQRWCLETYGDPYREYMSRTPKWIGIPKSEKRG